MEAIRTICSSTTAFTRSVVEWRSPATGPYLMLVNSIFWGIALFTSQTVQWRSLVGMACGVFGWDVLLYPSHDRSTLAHIALWPIGNLWRSGCVILSAVSAHRLNVGDLEVAFWTAYSSLGCFLISPAWTYYEVNRKISDTACYSMEKTTNGVKYVAQKVGSFLYTYVVYPIMVVLRAIKYVLFLEFVPPIIRWIRQKCSDFAQWVRNFCSSFRDACRNGVSGVIQWFKERVLAPIGRGFVAVGQFLRYWFCAHWWPGLKLWLKEKVWARCVRFFNYVCFCVVYVVCGHWIPPLSRWIWGHLCVLGAFLYKTVWTPSKQWTIRQLLVLLDLTKQLLHTLALAIRDSVLWPVGILLLDLAYQAYRVLHRTLLQPVIDVLYVKYKIVEDRALIYVLGPLCQKVIENIPEKSPFCDDSDVELDGFLPEEAMGGEEEKESEPDSAMEDDRFLPELAAADDSDFEHKMMEGLSFPAINASESSDEEFDLQSTRPKVTRRRRKKEPETVGAPENHDDTFELLQ